MTEENLRPPLSVRIRPWLIALPALLVLIGILYPFVTAIYYSFTGYQLNRPGSQNTFVGLQNYSRMITNPDFLYSTYITLAYALFTTGLELTIGLVIALLLNRESRVAKILTPMLIFPMMIAPGDRYSDMESYDAAERRHP